MFWSEPDTDLAAWLIPTKKQEFGKTRSGIALEREFGNSRSWSWRTHGRAGKVRHARLSGGDGLDDPVHHGADPVHVLDADAGVPAEVPAVGAEVAAVDVAEHDVVTGARPDGLHWLSESHRIKYVGKYSTYGSVPTFLTQLQKHFIGQAWRMIVLGQASRLIVFVRANAEGFYDELGWHMFDFWGRSVNHLMNELADRIAFIDGQDPDGIAMCVRAGRYGRLTPLVVDLPRYAGHAETHHIVVMMSGTPAYDELRYPDVNAISSKLRAVGLTVHLFISCATSDMMTAELDTCICP